jgi:hypothetical protein
MTAFLVSSLGSIVGRDRRVAHVQWLCLIEVIDGRRVIEALSRRAGRGVRESILTPAKKR